MRVLPLFAGLALLASLAACGGNEESASPLPDAGCQGAGCDSPDSSDLVDASVDPQPDAGQPDAGELPETDAGLAEDAGPPEDGGLLEDGGTADAGPGEPAGAIPGYLPCDDDSECPVGYGNCISAIPLNRRDSAGTLAVRVRALDPSLTKAGLCSLACTSNPGICDSLTIEDLQGEPVPYTCQVLVSGAPTYPSPRPAFPFAEQLSAQELQAGRAFGALCRPPLGLSARFDDAFCAACSGASDCGEGTCWSFAGWDEVLADGAGECLVRCADHLDCPFGFSCESLVSDRDGVPFEHGTFCLPFEQTCGACRDLDGDGRGLGRCGPGGAVLGDDCDDHDPRAFYDGTQMNHPFPEHCGLHDLNCNGLSDDAEQIGPAGFPAEHCTGCGQPCAGELPNASSACVWDHASLPSCVAECSDPSAWADCDGLLENGCEQEASDPARLYYLDADSDGYGAGEPVFACQAGLAPEGYVNQAGDCDDTAAAINPGVAADLCNGLDDDCDGETDEDQQTGGACDTGLVGVCGAGLLRCQGIDGLQCMQTTAPRAETCNGRDDDCDGQVDEEVPGAGEACNLGGLQGVCADGEMACDPDWWGLKCTQTRFPSSDDPPDDGLDWDCDGFDGTLAASIFVHAGAAEGGDGTREAPVRTVARAMELLAASPDKRAVYFSGAQYELHNTLELVNGVSFYGSRRADDWGPGAVRTSFIRTLANPPREHHLVGIQGWRITSPTLWKSIDLSFDSAAAPRHSIGLQCDRCSGLALADTSISSGMAGSGASGVAPPAGANGRPGSAGSGVAGGQGGVTDGNGGAGGNGGKGGALGVREYGDYAGAIGCGLPPFGGSSNSDSNANYGAPGDSGRACRASWPSAVGGASAQDPNCRDSDFWRRFCDSLIGGQKGSDGNAGFGAGGQGGGRYGGRGGDSGGAGGLGGPGGGGGGNSIGMLLFKSNGITFDGVTVNAGAGGMGGNGANGAKGGDGTDPLGAHAQYGAGGGGGGGGGGGAGGNSYAVLRGSTTSLGTVGLTLREGSAGQGGRGGQGGPAGSCLCSPGPLDGQAGLDGTDGEALPDKVFIDPFS